MVRMHAVDLVSDTLGGPHSSALRASMRMIAAEGRGAVVLIRDPTADRGVRAGGRADG